MSHSSFLRRFAAADGAPPTARQLYQTFTFLLYEFAYDEEFESARYRLADFTERWGRLSVDTLLEIARRFAPGQPRSEVDVVRRDDVAYYGPSTSEENDTCLVLAALGVLRTSETPEVLLPYLASPYAIERWLAALGLVTMRYEQVLPSLEQMLTEFVGPMQPWTPQGGCPQNFQLWRHRLLRLLADWGDSRVVPPIRAGLIATACAEEIEVPDPHDMEHEFVWRKDHIEQEFMWDGDRFTESEAWQWFQNKQLDWVNEEHQFVYTLGRLDAFGALEGVPARRGVYSWQNSWTDDDKVGDHFTRKAPEDRADGFRANIWRVLMCFGALESRFRGHLGTTYDFSDAPELAASVDQLLKERLGLDEAARRRAMEDFDQASWTHWIVFLYGWTAERARERAMLEEGGCEDGSEEIAEGEEMEESEPYDPPEISLEDREAQDFGWEDQW